MKTDPPPVRNPDAQLAAADIDTSRFDADTNNLGPRLGLAWSPQGRPLRRARRVGPVLRAHAVDHARHRALEQRRQHRVADVHRRRRADLSAEVRPDSGGRHRRAPEHLLHRQGLRERPADAGQRRGRVGGHARTRSLAVTYLFVDGSQLPRSIDRNLGTLGSRTFTVADTGATVLVSVLRCAGPAVREFPARHRVRVDRRVPLQRPDARAEPPASPAISSSAPPTRWARSRTRSPTRPRSSPATRATT